MTDAGRTVTFRGWQSVHLSKPFDGADSIAAVYLGSGMVVADCCMATDKDGRVLTHLPPRYVKEG